MDALVLLGQAVAFCVLAYGGYISITNWRVSDKEGIAREFRAGSGLQPPVERYDPTDDAKVAGEMGFLL